MDNNLQIKGTPIDIYLTFILNTYNCSHVQVNALKTVEKSIRMLHFSTFLKVFIFSSSFIYEMTMSRLLQQLQDST